jgi:hypothetical protein
MNVALLPLLPRGMEFRGNHFRILKDRHLFDTVAVATTDTTDSFFVSISTKKKSQAIFSGDQSLVKEANIFLVVGLQAIPRDVNQTNAVFKTFFRKGHFSFVCTVPESVVIDEDQLSSIAAGPNFELFANTNALDIAVDASRTYVGRRTYLVGENKVIPGGRAVEFTLNWLEAAGNGLTGATDVTTILAGGEYEPGQA